MHTTSSAHSRSVQSSHLGSRKHLIQRAWRSKYRNKHQTALLPKRLGLCSAVQCGVVHQGVNTPMAVTPARCCLPVHSYKAARTVIKSTGTGVQLYKAAACPRKRKTFVGFHFICLLLSFSASNIARSRLWQRCTEWASMATNIPDAPNGVRTARSTSLLSTPFDSILTARFLKSTFRARYSCFSQTTKHFTHSSLKWPAWHKINLEEKTLNKDTFR